MSVVIDAHQHFWELGRFNYQWLEAEPLEPIRKTYLPHHLNELIGEVGVHKTVFVQTQHNVAENRWVLEMADQNDFLAGVVGWVDLAGPECEAQVEEFKAHDKFVGVRHVTHDEPDDDFIVRDDVLRGLGVLEKHGIPFDLLFFVKHLHHAQTIAEKFPELPLVIDHLAKPEIKDQRTDNWVDNFRAAGKYPNVYCKLSGMVTEAAWREWKVDDFKPYVQTALEVFGPERCMFGSDWPVCELSGTYSEVFHLLQDALGPLSDSERDAIFGGTATKFYGLTV